MKKTVFSLMLALALGGCHEPKGSDGGACDTPPTARRAIYHWRTTFAPNAYERTFLRRHGVGRLYVHMFDVTEDYDGKSEEYVVQPEATTRFDASVDSLDVVPVAFITLEALQRMGGDVERYAELITRRLQAMTRYNFGCEAREVQFDCDWTFSTRGIFDRLCANARKILHADSATLSITVRLHQLHEPAPSADRGVLMLYNTGAIRCFDTHNSILSLGDVRPYLRRRVRYDLPLAVALPVFGWGVCFSDGNFQRLTRRDDYADRTLFARESENTYRVLRTEWGDDEYYFEDEIVRLERPTARDVLAAKRLVEKNVSPLSGEIILYHLDEKQLSHYEENDIEEIYARP